MSDEDRTKGSVELGVGPKAWEILKEMAMEFEQVTLHFPEPKMNLVVLERAMDIIEAARAVAILTRDGIQPFATMAQLQEAVKAFDSIGTDDAEPGDTEIITLEDEEGNEIEFTIARILTVDGRDYAVLEPLHDEHEVNPVILRIDTNAAGEHELVEIEDEEEFERVAEVWEETLDEEDGIEDPPVRK